MVILVVALLAIGSKAGDYLTCRASYLKDRVVQVNGKELQAEVADSAAERITGLSGRKCIGENQAMLFVFEQPGQKGIWMKDMKFPIDIIWLDENHKVVKVQSNVSPDTYPAQFSNEEAAKYVLELKAGQADKLGIRTGIVLMLK